MSNVLCIDSEGTFRSPLLASLLRQRYAASGRPDTIVKSAGLSGEAAGQAHDRIICLDEKAYWQMLKEWRPGARIMLVDIPDPLQKGPEAHRECIEHIKMLAEELGPSSQ